MKKLPYPAGCTRRTEKKVFLEETAIGMAKSGSFKNAHAIRQRLRSLGFGTLVSEVIPDVAEGFNFTYRLDDMCRTHFRDEHT